jgi:hypothetical protein
MNCEFPDILLSSGGTPMSQIKSRNEELLELVTDKIPTEAIKMFKQGIEEDVITEALKIKYINPLLETPKRKAEDRTMEEPVTKGMTDFTSFPRIPSVVRRFTRARRSLLLQKITENQSAVEYSSTNSLYTLPQTRRNVSASPISISESTEKSKPHTKTTSSQVYLCRLAECKNLKIWLRSVNSPGLI